MRMQRKIAIFGIVGIFSMGLSACSGTNSETSGGASVESSNKEISIAMNAGLVPQFEGYAKEFMDAYPEFTVTVRPVPDLSEDYIQQLTTESLSKTLADIIWENDTLNPTLESNGLLFDLNPWLEVGKGGISSENFEENFLGQYVVGEKITGIPVSADTGVIAYNKTIFDKYDVDFPKAGWTYDEMYDTAKKITEASGGDVFGLRTPIGIGRQYFTFYPVLVAYGTEVYDSDANEFVFANDGGIEAWTKLLEPYTEEFGSPFSIAENNTLFQSGQAAMHVFSTAQLAQMRDSMTDDWDCVPMPVIHGMQTTGGGSYSLSIPENANNKEGAWEFMSWFYSTDGGMTVAAQDGVIPASSDGIENGAWKTLDTPVSENFVETVTASVPNAILPPAIPADVQPKVVPVLQAAMQEVLINGTSVEKAYGDAQAELNELLK